MDEDQPLIDIIFNFAVVGDTSVGKTQLVQRFIHKQYRPNSQHTIGVDYQAILVDIDVDHNDKDKDKTINKSKKKVKLQIWDTAGQERFRSILSSYYRNADGILIVYDICNKNSFYHLNSWLNDIHNFSRRKPVVMLIGNKKDLEKQEKRMVACDEANVFAYENGLLFSECSAVTGENVDEAFLKMSKLLTSRIENQQYNYSESKSPGFVLGGYHPPAVPSIIARSNTKKTCCGS